MENRCRASQRQWWRSRHKTAYLTDERRDSITTWKTDAKRRVACNSKHSVATSPFLSQVSLWMTLDTTLENRRRACATSPKTSYLAQVIQDMPQDKKLGNRLRTSRRHHKTPFFGRNEPKETNRDEVGKMTPSVATLFFATRHKRLHLAWMGRRKPMATK
jgi:hypothetical protein